MASYESIYPGALYTTPSPSYYTPPSAYSTSAGNLGMALDARTANQLGDLNQKLKSIIVSWHWHFSIFLLLGPPVRPTAW